MLFLSLWCLKPSCQAFPLCCQAQQTLGTLLLTKRGLGLARPPQSFPVPGYLPQPPGWPDCALPPPEQAQLTPQRRRSRVCPNSSGPAGQRQAAELPWAQMTHLGHSGVTPTLLPFLFCQFLVANNLNLTAGRGAGAVVTLPGLWSYANKPCRPQFDLSRLPIGQSCSSVSGSGIHHWFVTRKKNQVLWHKGATTGYIAIAIDINID